MTEKMMERKENHTGDAPDRERPTAEDDVFPETEQHPVPGVEHKPEPDAGNIMPAEDQPGTF